MLYNYTPHPCNLIWADGHVETFPSVGVARCAQSTTTDEAASAASGYPITRTTFGAVEGLPDPEDGTFYLVSRLVLSACPNRRDLLVPNDVVRDDAGRIVGCRSFANN